LFALAATQPEAVYGSRGDHAGWVWQLANFFACMFGCGLERKRSVIIGSDPHSCLRNPVSD
jgi:excisionase family DNA binding protein